MWVEVKKAKSLMIAEMWKELFEGEGVPARIVPEAGTLVGQELGSYRIYIPDDKQHIVSEVLKRL